MLDIYTVAFFGHRYIDNPFRIEERLDEEIRRLLSEHEYVDFLVGRDGEFDQFASSAVLRVRKQYRDDNSSLILVLPYARAEYLNNEESYHDYYSDVEISYAASVAHPKAAIQIRNREMVDRADLILCCIEREKGGAWQTVQYAIKQGKTVINLAEEMDISGEDENDGKDKENFRNHCCSKRHDSRKRRTRNDGGDTSRYGIIRSSRPSIVETNYSGRERA